MLRIMFWCFSFGGAGGVITGAVEHWLGDIAALIAGLTYCAMVWIAVVTFGPDEGASDHDQAL